MQAPAVDTQRMRLFEGLAAAVAERGYATATIADIVRHAKVSKRTFYEHFADKEACFLAMYVMATDTMLAAIAAAFEAAAGAPWQEQVDAAVDAYVTTLESAPALTRSCLVEIHAAGARAVERRREVHGAFAQMLRDLVARTRRKHPELSPISAEMATALVGGINELLLVQVERGPRARLPALRETASALIRAVLATPRERTARGGPDRRRARSSPSSR